MWTAVALQQHMLREMDAAGRLGPELQRTAPRPLRDGQLSLAQKMGLVERPPDAPTPDAWDRLEAQSAIRRDLARPCAICCMAFPPAGDDSAVILSCSHVFHAKCLQQLERHAKACGQQRRCPVCRHSAYFRRPNASAPAILQTNAVVRIQSAYRGHAARRLYVRMRCARDPQFRADYYYGRLKRMTDLRLAEHAAHEGEVERALADIDYVMDVCAASGLTDADWAAVAAAAMRREHLDCAVCLCATVVGGADAAVTVGAPIDGAWPDEQRDRPPSAVGGGPRDLVLTSCSHLYHAACLRSMEQFCAGDKPRCACCRKGYLKRMCVVAGVAS